MDNQLAPFVSGFLFAGLLWLSALVVGLIKELIHVRLILRRVRKEMEDGSLAVRCNRCGSHCLMVNRGDK